MKWETEPVVGVGFAQKHQATAKETLADIANALKIIKAETGAKFRFNKDIEKANVRVLFLPRKDYGALLAKLPGLESNDWQQFARNALCLGVPLTNTAGSAAIAGVVVLLPTDRSLHDRRACAYEELFQSTGLVADACEYRPSLFCEADRHIIEPTETDKLLLKALYDPRLEAGMSEAEAMPIARTILREMWPS